MPLLLLAALILSGPFLLKSLFLGLLGALAVPLGALMALALVWRLLR